MPRTFTVLTPGVIHPAAAAGEHDLRSLLPAPVGNHVDRRAPPRARPQRHPLDDLRLHRPLPGGDRMAVRSGAGGGGHFPGQVTRWWSGRVGWAPVRGGRVGCAGAGPGWRCGCARFRRRGGRDRWARAAPRRRPRVGGAVTVAARSRPTSPAGAGSTTSRSATNPPPATPSTMTTPPWPGYARRRAWVATWSASADVGRGDGVCEECRADGLGRNSIKLRCAANLDAPVRRGP